MSRDGKMETEELSNFMTMAKIKKKAFRRSSQQFNNEC